MSLMKRLNLLIERYMNQYIAAPVKWGEKVFGRSVPTKNDVRRGFLQDLKMIAEVAKLDNNTEVLNKINNTLDDNFSAEVSALKAVVNK